MSFSRPMQTAIGFIIVRCLAYAHFKCVFAADKIPAWATGAAFLHARRYKERVSLLSPPFSYPRDSVSSCRFTSHATNTVRASFNQELIFSRFAVRSIFLHFVPVFLIRIWDPVPFWSRDPEWVENKDRSGFVIRDEHNGSNFRELRNIFWVKILEFFDVDPSGSGIRNLPYPGSETRDEKILTGINIPDLQHCFIQLCIICYPSRRMLWLNPPIDMPKAKLWPFYHFLELSFQFLWKRENSF